MTNVRTLRDINKGHRLGSMYEEELENKLYTALKSKTENDKSSVSDQISQETDSDKDDNITLEEWHAPRYEKEMYDATKIITNLNTLVYHYIGLPGKENRE
ncbi:20224_t:CDS:2 [Entrophospora sp. SA101]|nr:20224_t:CDS:2 [Entrophospora sp. SA101]